MWLSTSHTTIGTELHTDQCCSLDARIHRRLYGPMLDRDCQTCNTCNTPPRAPSMHARDVPTVVDSSVAIHGCLQSRLVQHIPSRVRVPRLELGEAKFGSRGGICTLRGDGTAEWYTIECQFSNSAGMHPYVGEQLARTQTMLSLGYRQRHQAPVCGAYAACKDSLPKLRVEP